eukprot:scaffold112868_cov31-Tisochrysis_lutea.AAC.1
MRHKDERVIRRKLDSRLHSVAHTQEAPVSRLDRGMQGRGQLMEYYGQPSRSPRSDVKEQGIAHLFIRKKAALFAQTGQRHH